MTTLMSASSTTDLPEYMVTGEFATVARMTPGHAANMRSAGIGPRFIKRNGIVRYRRADVVAWLDGGLVNTLDQPKVSA